MLTPAKLFQLLTEMVFFLLGALLAVLAVSGRFFPDRRSPAWLALAAVLMFLGLRACSRAGRYATRTQNLLRGASLALVGVLMLCIAWAPFSWIRPLLGAAGGVLALRGLASAAVVVRSP